MHTLQYIATKADSVDEAFNNVKQNLEGQLGDDPYTAGSAAWFDWFVVGGGRFAKDESKQYDDEYQGEVAHQDEPLFQEYLETIRKGRKAELDSLMEEARKINLIELLDNITDASDNNYRSALTLYPVKKIYDMTIGLWDFNSYYYDMNTDSIQIVHMLNAIEKGDKDWYLVPVDFHF